MTRPADTPRDAHATRIETIELPQAKSFASFIRSGDEGGPVPCWGALEERFIADFKEDTDRLKLWNVLVENGDRRSLLIFIEQARSQPDVLAKVVSDAHRLAPELQRAVVSLDEADKLLTKEAKRLHPAARQLWEAGAVARCREREQMEARISQLRAFRYFTPDVFDPKDEPPAKNRTEDPNRPGENTTRPPEPNEHETGGTAGAPALVLDQPAPPSRVAATPEDDQ